MSLTILNIIKFITPQSLLPFLKVIRHTLWVYQYQLTSQSRSPKSIAIDPSNACNLKCPLCPTGIKKLKDHIGFMSFELFKKTIDQIPTLEWVYLYNWGEPFLNKDILKMISYASSKKIKTEIHSNFSLHFKNEFFPKLIESGLTSLILSIDGSSQSEYEKYRIGGNLELVLKNIRLLVEAQKKQSSKNPKIRWKFLVNKFNESEINNAKKIAKNLKIDFFTSTIHLSEYSADLNHPLSLQERKNKWLPKNKKHLKHPYKASSKYFYQSPCPHLFDEPVINPQGKVFPCCHITDKKNAFGDLNTESFFSIWNNEKYKNSRNLFTRSIEQKSENKTICSNCTIYKQKNIKPWYRRRDLIGASETFVHQSAINQKRAKVYPKKAREF